MPLMRINYYVYAEDEKLVQELGKGLRGWNLCISITEDSEIFFEVGSDSAVREAERTTSHHLE